jgi:hypothetical protein
MAIAQDLRFSGKAWVNAIVDADRRRLRARQHLVGFAVAMTKERMSGLAAGPAIGFSGPRPARLQHSST